MYFCYIVFIYDEISDINKRKSKSDLDSAERSEDRPYCA